MSAREWWKEVTDGVEYNRHVATTPLACPIIRTCTECGQGHTTTRRGVVVRVECRCGRINWTGGPKLGVCPECNEKYCRCPKVPT